MLPFKVHASVVCDDIRQEINNKFMLIGVYNGTVVTPGFPLDMLMTWWIQVFPEKLGSFELDIQLIKSDNSILRAGKFEVELKELEWSSFSLPRLPVQFQSPGRYKLQIKMPDEGQWQTVNEFDVKHGTGPGLTELLVPLR
jgi:uncharacterized protein DUF6941